LRPFVRPLIAGLSIVAAGVAVAGAQTPAPRFEEQTLDTQFQIGYAVTLADLNGDRKQDVVLVTERQVVWYENPSWQRHVILSDAVPRDNVCAAAADVDGDGRAELAMGAFWKPSDTEKSGSVHWLQRGADPRQPWTPVDLEPEPTVHRMRWADLRGDGKLALVMAPLHGRGNKGPDFTGAGVRVVAYHPPADPAKQPWRKEMLSDDLHVVHNLWPMQWDTDRDSEILLCSFEGIHLLDRQSDGKWLRTQLHEGNQATRPNRGSSEIKAGALPSGSRYIATVEPWHGNQIVVYTRLKGDGWERKVLDETMREAHGIWCADVDGRPGDELIAGWRGPDSVNKKVGVAMFTAADAQGTRWEKRILDDNGMACEDLTAGDLDGDGRVDIVSAGRATHNLKIYWNR